MRHIGFFPRIMWDIRKNKYIYIMLIPVILFYLVFAYKPMYGVIIAFKDFDPMRGILGSEWVGLRYFNSFFSSPFFERTLRNTVLLNLNMLIFAFPAPIILALLLNEVKNRLYKRTVQSIVYIPHFISIVVVCALIKNFTSNDGLINDILAFFGGQRVSMLMEQEYFRPVYVISGIWQGIGWESIIYLAALTSIEMEMYEAAIIDGAGRWKQMVHITLPGIRPVVVIMFILSIGNIMSVGFEKVFLLYNPSTYETSDVIATYVYRKGINEFNFSFASAVGLFNSVINFCLVMTSNWISRKVNGTSLW